MRWDGSIFYSFLYERKNRDKKSSIDLNKFTTILLACGILFVFYYAKQ